LLAILQGEPTAKRLLAAVEADHSRLVSAATVVEASLVMLGRFGEAGDLQLDRLLRARGVEVVPVGEDQAVLAREEPLLFVGADLSQRDVEVCAW